MEPDVLDMWFARERKSWWRKWRWLAVVFWIWFAVVVLHWLMQNYILLHPSYYERWLKAMYSSPLAGLLLGFFEEYWGLPEVILVGLASFLAYSQSPNRLRGADWRLAYSADILYYRIVNNTRTNVQRWIIPCALAIIVFLVSAWFNPGTPNDPVDLALRCLAAMLMLALIAEWAAWMNSLLTRWIHPWIIAAFSVCWFWGSIEGIEMLYWNLLAPVLVSGSSYSEQITWSLTGLTVLLLAGIFHMLTRYPPARYQEILYSD